MISRKLITVTACVDTTIGKAIKAANHDEGPNRHTLLIYANRKLSLLCALKHSQWLILLSAKCKSAALKNDFDTKVMIHWLGFSFLDSILLGWSEILLLLRNANLFLRQDWIHFDDQQI